MKRRDAIALLICLMAMSLTLAVKYWPRGVPLEECSETYRALKDNPHLSVSYIKGLRINDTTAIDATLLHALDTIGWDSLMHYFGLPQEMIDLYHTAYDSFKSDHQHTMMNFYCDKKNPACRALLSSGGGDFVTAIIDEQTFCIYHIETIEQAHIIAAKEIKKINTQQK